MKKLLWIIGPVLSFILGWFVAELIKPHLKTTVNIKVEQKQQDWFTERTNEIITTFYKNWKDKPLQLKFNEELAYIRGNTEKLTGNEHYEIALNKMRNEFTISYFVDVDADYYTKWIEKDTNKELRDWIDKCRANVWSNE